MNPKPDVADEPEREVLRCRECGSVDVVVDPIRGEKICQKCGVVLGERLIDVGPEWRAFTTDERNKRSRVGSPTTYTVHDKGLSTMIDWHDKDFYGKKLSPKRRAQVYRLRKWQIRTRVHSSMDRNFSSSIFPVPTSANVPTMLRTMKRRNPLASI